MFKFQVGLEHYLILAAIIFAIGLGGLLFNRKNLVNLLMFIELMLLATSINFTAFSVYFQEISGQVFAIMILAVAAAEVSVGLAILVLLFKNKGSIEVEDLSEMRG